MTGENLQHILDLTIILRHGIKIVLIFIVHFSKILVFLTNVKNPLNRWRELLTRIFSVRAWCQFKLITLSATA
jgi:hypothetical protein